MPIRKVVVMSSLLPRPTSEDEALEACLERLDTALKKVEADHGGFSVTLQSPPSGFLVANYKKTSARLVSIHEEAVEQDAAQVQRATRFLRKKA